MHTRAASRTYQSDFCGESLAKKSLLISFRNTVIRARMNKDVGHNRQKRAMALIVIHMCACVRVYSRSVEEVERRRPHLREIPRWK